MITEVRLPEISENVDSGEVIEIMVSVGDTVEVDQPVVELETEKASFELPSTVAGKVTDIAVSKGQTIKVGEVILKVETDTQAEPAVHEEPATVTETATEKEPPRPQTPVKPERTETIEPISAKQQAPAAPSVRQLAREMGIAIDEVPGSGPGGRISAEDVKEYVKTIITGTPAGTSSTATVRQLPDFTKWGQVERKPMTATRKSIADTLSYAWQNIPHVTQYDKADITGLMEFRSQYAQQVEQAGGKLTITSILIKVVASALEQFPEFNASVDTATKQIVFKKFYNISIAVDTDRGLLVPVIQDVNKKNILQLSVELSQLADRTRNHKVSVEDMVGGNFTISNLGGIAGTNFSPIIYWPQVAILGVSRASREPAFIDGRFEPRWMLPLSVTYDHRIIDGAQGVRFLKAIVQMLQEPFLLALNEGVR